jgi:hypothetical protein
VYDMLDTRELTVLQSMLYEATEEAFRIVCEDDLKLDSAQDYRAIHWEIAHLFIGAATELVDRLDNLASMIQGADPSAAELNSGGQMRRTKKPVGSAR